MLCVRLAYGTVVSYLHTPVGYIQFISRMGGEELSVDKVIRITNPKAEELIQKFDEHTIDKCHKFGVIYQQKGQVRISYACT